MERNDSNTPGEEQRIERDDTAATGDERRVTDETTRTNGNDGLPIVEGAAAGLLAWVAGYLATYLVVASNVRDSPLNRIVEAFDGAPATYEMVGWVFYNAHFVDTVFSDVPILGSVTTTYVGGEEGFTALLYAVPVVLLFLAGFAVARYRDSRDPTAGALAGATVLSGYLLLSVAGLFLFEIAVGGASAAPDRLAGGVLAGVVYPLVFAGVGGAVAGVVGNR